MRIGLKIIVEATHEAAEFYRWDRNRATTASDDPLPPAPRSDTRFLPGLALLVGLGLWQIQRLGEKEALIASVAAGMKAPPVPLAESLRAGAEKSEYRHVQLRGHFLHDKEVYLFSRGPKGAVGVDVVTPLVEDNGETVLVDRGFVPEALRDPKSREPGQVAGEVTLTGVLRLPRRPEFSRLRPITRPGSGS